MTAAIARARRALAEFRDPRGVDEHPVPDGRGRRSGLQCGTGRDDFIDKRPATPDRAHVARPRHEGPRLPRRGDGQLALRPTGTTGSAPGDKQSEDRPRIVPAPGQQAAPDGAGPGGFREVAARLAGGGRHRHHVPRRASVAARATARTHGLLAVAPYSRRMMPQLLSVECWGGATYDVALRFLRRIRGSGWRRCARWCPTSRLQMLLRGRNTVGYTPYPEWSRTRSSTRRRRPASTSSASSTRSTTSLRWRRRSTLSAQRAPRCRRSR